MIQFGLWFDTLKPTQSEPNHNLFKYYYITYYILLIYNGRVREENLIGLIWFTPRNIWHRSKRVCLTYE